MAIDTENKRRSAISVLPVPNSDIDQADRQQVTWNFRGVLSITTLLTSQTVEVWLNGRQFLVLESDLVGQEGAVALIAAIGSGLKFDNAVIWERVAALTAGVIDDTDSTDATEFPKDTQLQVMSYNADILDWEWRTTAKAGAGNDEIDVGATVGEDVSADIIFEEGKNLVNLSLHPSGQKLATLIQFWGQGQDDNQRLAQSYDFPAWDTYGVIEEGISDQRISTNNLAKQKADNELVKRKDGTASLTATVIDNSKTLNQWREGDIVWVKTNRPDLDRTARIMEVEYVSGSLERSVTFDKFPRSRSGNIGRLMDDVGLVNRGTKGNAGRTVLHFKPGPRIVDDFDPRIRYVNGDPDVKWESWTGFLATGAYGATLHGTYKNGNYAELDFEGTGIAVVCRTGPNLVDASAGKFMDISIDGALVSQVGLQSDDNIDGVQVFVTNSLSSGPHTIKLQRSGSDTGFIYIDIDHFRLSGWLWQFFLEGRAVNSSLLTYTLSQQAVPIQLVIDGTDRTAALGGGTGFTGDQTNLDVTQFISAPGLHTIEFINTSTTVETFLEASLACKLLI